jgi:hypothetical protein
MWCRLVIQDGLLDRQALELGSAECDLSSSPRGGKAHDTHDTTLSIAIAPIKKAMSSNFDTVTGGYQPFESDENPKMKVNHC